MFGGGWEGGHAGCVGGDLGGAFWGHSSGLVWLWGGREGGLKGVGVGGGGGEGAVCMCVCMGGVEVEVEVEVEEEDNVADFQDEIAKTGNLVWAETVPRTAIWDGRASS